MAAPPLCLPAASLGGPLGESGAGVSGSSRAVADPHTVAFCDQVSIPKVLPAVARKPRSSGVPRHDCPAAVDLGPSPSSCAASGKRWQRVVGGALHVTRKVEHCGKTLPDLSVKTCSDSADY